MTKLHKFLNFPSIKKFIGEEQYLLKSSPLKKQMRNDDNIDGFQVNSQKDEIFLIDKVDKYQDSKKKVELDYSNKQENKLGNMNKHTNEEDQEI